MVRSRILCGALALLIGLSDCNYGDNIVETRPEVSYEKRIDDYFKGRIEGFGEIRKSRSFQWKGTELFESEDGHYIGLFEDELYLFDKKGKLLTPGSWKIIKDKEDIFLLDNSKIRLNKVPKDLLGIKDDHHRRVLFEQENGWINVRKK